MANNPESCLKKVNPLVTAGAVLKPKRRRHAGKLKLHVKLPVFVARQWIRHRTANVNEYSARYSILDREFYIPRAEDLAAQSAQNNQGRGDVLGPEESARVLD
ncbi:MAG TPA: FAD-dependent thymidylate synthase, partial [Pseudomonadales bacterium]|nr:FAD-dependent thymidylate synthase [Pseudomonadales bacterium]